MAGEPRFTKLGTAVTDLTTAWQDRLADADALLAAGRHASSIAMGLYALEIYLKTRICKKLDLDKLPSAFEIHDLDGLLILAGLSRRLNSKRLLKSAVKRNWDRVRNTSKQINDLRYLPDRGWGRAEATTFLDQLREPKNGVLSWLARQR